MLSPPLCQINICWSKCFTHWLPCNILSLFESLQPSIAALKISAHLSWLFHQPTFSTFAIHCSILLSNMANQSKQPLFCIALLCSLNPHEFLNITSFQSLLFNTILDFLIHRQGEEWDSICLGVFTFSSFIFVHFFNVLLVFPLFCPCFFFVSCIQATKREIGRGHLPFDDLVVGIVYWSI